MLILDTDIGSDVDDAMALGVVLGSPELAPFAVTTVYGDTTLRAQLTTRLLSLSAGAHPTHIVPGRTETLSGKPVWWAGHEGKRYSDLSREAVTAGEDAVAFITRIAAEHPGEVDLLAIGPLTNVAECLNTDPDFAVNLRRLVIMGGDFRVGAARVAEHNIASDITAAQRVFDSDLEIAVGGLDLTMQLTVGRSIVDEIASSGPFGAALAEEIAEWWTFLDHSENTPHDPILAIYLARPDLFNTVRARVTISDDGITHEHATENGTVQIVQGMKRETVLEEIVQRIRAAG
ncbi:nucleoside hydrolase [Planctomonas sp. JC2975]|uniref:nucleoside hydrolase n=1 Tax=Planctomonas sp. JC2975 TaxID=2729626 RepID=UPI00147455AA|nr:nucleoside hydrolase [Planctomonas sp. JC2975]NNC13771.1 nucleoside hydrolase [Planctomonas sp. JC2975]